MKQKQHIDKLKYHINKICLILKKKYIYIINYIYIY